MVGWIILGVTIAAFLAVGIWIATAGRKLRWPKGKRVTRVRGAATVEIIYTGVPRDEVFERACLAAVDAVEKAWAEEFPDETDVIWDVLQHVAIHTLADRDYDALDKGEWAESTNGFQSYVSRAFGGGIPKVVMRHTFAHLVEEHGGLVVHELTHALAREMGFGPDYRHRNPELWGESGLQGEARAWFQSEDFG